MKRICMDCSECPGNDHCSMVLCSKSESDLLEAAVSHFVAAHKRTDTPELRENLTKFFREKNIEIPGRSYDEILSNLWSIRIPF